MTPLRAAFEKWAKPRYSETHSLAFSNDAGFYHDPFVQAAWSGWIAWQAVQPEAQATVCPICGNPGCEGTHALPPDDYRDHPMGAYEPAATPKEAAAELPPLLRTHMIVCEHCGDKRCVHANDEKAPCAWVDLYAHNRWVERALAALKGA